jgi:hypothetical protein
LPDRIHPPDRARLSNISGRKDKCKLALALIALIPMPWSGIVFRVRDGMFSWSDSLPHRICFLFC